MGEASDAAELSAYLAMTPRTLTENIDSLKKERDVAKAKVDGELMTAMPALHRASMALEDLDKRSLNQIKAYEEPPDAVEKTMHAVLTLLRKESSWDQARKELSNIGFLRDLMEYNKDEITSAMMNEVEAFTSNPQYAPELVQNVSGGAGALCLWVHAMESYFRAAKPAESEILSLRNLEQKLEELERKKREQMIEAGEMMPVPESDNLGMEAIKQTLIDAQKDLGAAMPAIEAARSTLQDTFPDEECIAELKAFAKPPDLVVMTMAAVLTTMGGHETNNRDISDDDGGWKIETEEITWELSLAALSDERFLSRLKSFSADVCNPENVIKQFQVISGETLCKLEKYTKDPRFVPRDVSEVSRAAGILCTWVHAAKIYTHIYQEVVPKLALLTQLLAMDQESMDKFRAAAEALEQIKDLKLQETVTQLQDSMHTAMFVGDSAKAHEIFQTLQKLVEPEVERLGKLINTVMQKYRALGVRFAYLERIPKEEGECKQLLPGGTGHEADDHVKAVKIMLSQASRVESDFRERMTELVQEFNSAESIHVIKRANNLDAGDFLVDLRSAHIQLKAGSSAVVIGTFGPPKSFDRALAKGCSSLKDLNRIAMEFEDPYVMALMLAVLKKRFKVVTVKNKFKQDVFEQPPDLHVNIDFAEGWIVEVQLLLKDFLTIKKTQHKFYEITRAAHPEDLCQRVFHETRWVDMVGGEDVAAQPATGQGANKAASANLSAGAAGSGLHAVRVLGVEK